MLVRELMSRDVALIHPERSIREAAEQMHKIDAGVLPVANDERLVGMITDRDIAVRAVAAGLGPDTPVSAVMSNEICYCFDDQTINEVANNMANIRVRRLPVMNRNKRLVGILSIADIALANESDGSTEMAVCGISEPGGQHSQSGQRQAA